MDNATTRPTYWKMETVNTTVFSLQTMLASSGSGTRGLYLYVWGREGGEREGGGREGGRGERGREGGREYA